MRIYAQSNVQAVDLGLPSSTLWADRNLGAKNIEDCGGYFSWGESTPKNKHSLRKFCKMLVRKLQIDKSLGR